MITNPEWLKPKEKPYFHQISLYCIGELVIRNNRFEMIRRIFRDVEIPPEEDTSLSLLYDRVE